MVAKEMGIDVEELQKQKEEAVKLQQEAFAQNGGVPNAGSNFNPGNQDPQMDKKQDEEESGDTENQADQVDTCQRRRSFD